MDFSSALPEGIVSDILSLTSPRDACRSSAISKGFKSVADSDAVWDRFLPSDHAAILSRSVSPVPSSTKKQLYSRLADCPILLDGGKLSFALDKASAKKCFMLGARELAIVQGSSPENWEWVSLLQSRFSEVAHLLQVCWFCIEGKIEAQLLSPKTTYVVYLVFQMRRSDNGFDYLPLDAFVSFVGERGDRDEDAIIHETKMNIVYLKRGLSSPQIGASTRRLPQKRLDKWMEVELGEFFIGKGDSGKVVMGLMAVERGRRTSGIIIEGIEVRPKSNS